MHWGIFVLFVCNSPADYLIRSAVYIASHYNVLRTRSRVRIQHVLITCFAHVFKKKSFIYMLIQSISDQTYTGGKRYKRVLQCPRMFVKEYFSELWGPCTDYIRFFFSNFLMNNSI